jgi:hypothetical protein
MKFKNPFKPKTVNNSQASSAKPSKQSSSGLLLQGFEHGGGVELRASRRHAPVHDLQPGGNLSSVQWRPSVNNPR